MERSIPKHVQVAERQSSNRRRGRIEDLVSIFGPPPLLEGEDELAFFDLWERVRLAIEPRDVIDEMFARDYANNCWETLRLLRDQAQILRAAGRRAAFRLIRSVNRDTAASLEKTPGASEAKIGGVLANLGLTWDQAHAEARETTHEVVGRLEASLIKLEARRNATLREADRRKEVAHRLKLMSEAIVNEQSRALPGSRP